MCHYLKHFICFSCSPIFSVCLEISFSCRHNGISIRQIYFNICIRDLPRRARCLISQVDRGTRIHYPLQAVVMQVKMVRVRDTCSLLCTSRVIIPLVTQYYQWAWFVMILIQGKYCGCSEKYTFNVAALYATIVPSLPPKTGNARHRRSEPSTTHPIKVSHASHTAPELPSKNGTKQVDQTDG